MIEIHLNTSECRVLKQIFDVLLLTNGKTVTQEIQDIEQAPYVVGFVPGPGQVRLDRDQWQAFVGKLHQITGAVQGEKTRVSETDCQETT